MTVEETVTCAGAMGMGSKEAPPKPRRGGSYVGWHRTDRVLSPASPGYLRKP